MTPRDRRGFTLTEAVVTVAVAVAVGLPLLHLVRTSDVQVVTSEDAMFAEVLAHRRLETALVESPPDLEKRLPLEQTYEGTDEVEERRTDDLPAYAANLGTSDNAFRSLLRVDRAAPGLLRYAVTVTWPVAPGSPARRHLRLVRLRCVPTWSMTTTYPQGGSDGQRQSLRGLR